MNVWIYGRHQRRSTCCYIVLPPWKICFDHLLSQAYSLLINVDKTKVLASDDIVCHILIQNEQLEQVDTFPYLGSLITEDGECATEFHTTLKGQAIGASLQEIWKKHSIPISTKIKQWNKMQSVQCLHSTNSDQQWDNPSGKVHPVLTATHKFTHKWN